MPVHDWTRVDAGIFHAFHTTWIALLAVRLNEVLPPEYYALPETKAMGYEPDILTLGRKAPRNGNGANEREGPVGASRSGGLSIMASPPKVTYLMRRPATHKQRSIVVRRAEDDRVVAIIEVVSSGNKSTGHALRAFVAKVTAFLDRGVNALIVDLYPPNRHDPEGIHVAIWGEAARIESPLPPGKPLLSAAFAVADDERAYVEPFAVGDSLPEMPLCLESDLYVSVPLEATYMIAFNGFPRRWKEVLTEPIAGETDHGT
jgi:hypothetical protein